MLEKVYEIFIWFLSGEYTEISILHKTFIISN